jgi:agmatine deiminase
MLRRLGLVALTLSLFALPALAEMDVDGLEELLPRHETEAERLAWQGREHLMPGGDRMSDPPPAAPIRNCAEWEPSTGVIVRYPLGLPYGLLVDLADAGTLHVVVSSGYQSTAQSNLSANGVNMANVEFLVRNNDSIWTRDYGPWYVFDGAGDVAIIDHTYNRPYRPNDNLIPIYFAQQQGIPVHSHDMYHTGGNYMTDGAHISSSTRLVYSEASGMNEAQVDQLMFDYYGVTTYNVLDYIESGGIHHIDTWAKFLDEETVLVKDVWSSHHTYSALNQRATLLASLQSSTGRNYQVHRVYCYNIGGGSPASYTNSLINNGKIYVPTFGSSGYDNDALAAYEAAAPGYEVEGYYYGGFISDDALHCRTKNAHDMGMLRVAHVPVFDEQSGEVTIDAHIRAHSGSAISSATIHYRQNGGAWETTPLSFASGYDYQGTIPAPPADGSTDYYLHVTDADGRAEGMPRVEPARWYSFDHLSGDLTDAPVAPALAELHANYPNPFNPKTTFSFELLHSDQVELAVYDMQGKQVRSLIDGLVPAGATSVEWDGKDDAGEALPSGVYLYRLRAAGLQYSRPATLLK